MNNKNQGNGFKLIKKIFISGTIEVKTGLSIGGGSVGLEIGGADKVVVRNPLTNQPYVPGSSLKGKMRSLLEKLEGKLTIGQDKEGNITAKPCECGTCLICNIFGVAAEKKCMPARLIVRDGELSGIVEDDKISIGNEYVKKLLNSKFTDMPYTEVKTEVVIDRITSAATPRSFERVPAGAVFSLNLVCNIYQNDNEQEILGKVFEALTLVQEDYLGGSGTRGYGEVKIAVDPLKYKDQSIYEAKGEAQPLNNITIPQALLQENKGEVAESPNNIPQALQ